MKHSFYLILIVSIAILFMASGCNLPFSIQVVPQNQATEVPATEAAPSQTPIIITQTPLPTEAPTNTAEAVATEEPTATLEPTAIVHSSVPGDSSYLSDQVASDCDTGIRSAGQAQGQGAISLRLQGEGVAKALLEEGLEPDECHLGECRPHLL